MTIYLFIKFWVADKLKQPIHLKNKTIIDYAISMKFVEYIILDFDSDLIPVVKKNQFNLTHEGRKAYYNFQSQMITWIIAITALLISLLAYLRTLK